MAIRASPVLLQDHRADRNGENIMTGTIIGLLNRLPCPAGHIPFSERKHSTNGRAGGAGRLPRRHDREHLHFCAILHHIAVEPPIGSDRPEASHCEHSPYLKPRMYLKPQIQLMGLSGCSMSVFAFGLSKSVWAMVVARSMCVLMAAT